MWDWGLCTLSAGHISCLASIQVGRTGRHGGCRRERRSVLWRLDSTVKTHFIRLGAIQISLANLVTVAFIVALLVPAIVAAVPKATEQAVTSAPSASQTERRSWTRVVRKHAVRTLPPDKLPGPSALFNESWIYVFGVATLAALMIFVVASGVVLTLEGPQWYHVSALGHFVNSLHLWSVELFFGFMVVHLWGKFWMAAWRGFWAMTWITGVVWFLASIGTAFTGYLVQTNFDSQWISSEAKDSLNSVGISCLVQRAQPRADAALARGACCPSAWARSWSGAYCLFAGGGVEPPL